MTDFSTAPLRELRMLRATEVCRLVGLSRSRIRQLETQGRFPPRVPIGDNAVRWPEGDIRRWLAERAALGCKATNKKSQEE